MNIKEIFKSLQKVNHPESKSDIVTLGMVQEIKIEGNKVSFTLIFKTNSDPSINQIRQACVQQLETDFEDIAIRGNIKVRALQKDPQLSGLDKVKNIVAVVSGKGGVGKSTVAVNLAVALSQKGYKVGLLDADVYGPSLPKMFDLESAHPEVNSSDGRTEITPLEKYGVKVMSMGFFVDPDQPLVWRGPMATNALKQLLLEPNWGELDYLILDMPPGTGDIHLTAVQTVALTGIVVVSTPQKVAIADVIKGINMFRSNSISVPVLGLVENMAWFTPDELPDNRYYIFGKGELAKVAKQFDTPILGQIPIVESIAHDSDIGEPPALKNNLIGKSFMQLAENVVKAVERRNEEFAPTTIVDVK
ncbi:MAG: Mrp/NBP35 family ATP-binding protein [Salinivirgaceae bacterium]|nr:Mrp/NBP35 family ATP-binding protein [Salinivirgaceae bacterium]MDD4746558.1 Mrp/NBP35 family ATP-binding protein [Salinivirgaceae bacterium]MDY0279618.1 Mrp/NBP35 family ATP-binding protein [Salinivirgaceae bacterium]